MRIVIASTGRSGTTWLQLLLTYVYDALPAGARDFDPDTGVFRDEAEGALALRLLRNSAGGGYRTWEELWRSLPQRCVLHTHWAAYPAIVEELGDRRYPVITMARHPLDILISHLAWVNRASRDDFGLPELRGLEPTSPAFVEWSQSDLVRWLLGITGGWWLRDGVVRVRYEEMVAAPDQELGRVVGEIEFPSTRSIEGAVKESELGRLKAEKPGVLKLLPERQRTALLSLRRNLVRFGARAAFIDEHRARRHFWQGRPNLWRELLPADEARAIAGTHQELFAFFGYQCDFDPDLSVEQARRNWAQLLAS